VTAEDHNIELVRRLYELNARGEIDEAVTYLADDVEWVEPPENPDASTRIGRDQARRSNEDWSSTWGSLQIDVLDLSADGDLVLAHLKIGVEGAGSGVPAEFEQHQVWTVRNGKVTRMQMFYDEGEAKRAAGIETAIEETT
jgi:ketosteroid isomerase-like protein